MASLEPCTFCPERATWQYEPDTFFCRWHLVLFYLGLKGGWHD